MLKNSSPHTFKFASAVILPILLKVKLFVAALFIVIPAGLSFNCKAIEDVVGSFALLLCNEKFISLVGITFDELFASAL